MDDVFVYLIDMPSNIRESVVPCLDGYTIYINKDIAQSEQEKAYRHALKHIEHMDFEKHDVNTIESEAHKKP